MLRILTILMICFPSWGVTATVFAQNQAVLTKAKPGMVVKKKKNTHPSKTTQQPETSVQPYLERPVVQEFIDQLVAKDALPRGALEDWLGDVKYQPKVIQLLDAPIAKPPAWYQYHPFFVNKERIKGGTAFWQAHRAALQQAEMQYGVPAAIILAILGVETNYGNIKGNFSVLSALTTLAFDYPRRAEYFREELRQFLLLAHEQSWNPRYAKGSYAGAMGIPQFMPTNIRKFGVDFDGDGQINLWSDPEDVIGSVAHYLAEHGWQRGQEILLPVASLGSLQANPLGSIEEDPVGTKLEKPLLWSYWRDQGVLLALGASEQQGGEDLPGQTEAGLLMLEETKGPTYWLALPNFYVLTRYNRSRLYAAAVVRLADEISRAAGILGEPKGISKPSQGGFSSIVP